MNNPFKPIIFLRTIKHNTYIDPSPCLSKKEKNLFLTFEQLYEAAPNYATARAAFLVHALLRQLTGASLLFA